MSEKEIEDLVKKWAKRLGISHYDIFVSVEKIKPRTTTMRCTKSPNYDRCQILVQPWVLKSEPPSDWKKCNVRSFKEEMEISIIHEVIHLALWEMAQTIRYLQDSSKKSDFYIVVGMQEQLEENVVDRMACSLFDSQ